MTRGDAEKMLGELRQTRPQTDRHAARASSSDWSNRPAKRSAAATVARCANRPPRQRAARGKNWARWARPAARSRRPRGRRRGEQLEVEIDSLAFGGRGVARADGFVVFVAGGAARRQGPRRGHQSRRSASPRRARSSCSRPSADRVPDTCVHGGEPCPGAPWQGLAYERQLEHKSEQVDDALRRIGDLEGFELEPIVPAPKQWRYRNKLEYSFGERRGRARARLPRPRPLGPDRRRRGLPPRLRGRQRRPQRRSATGPRTEAVPAYDAARPQRRPAQPRRPRGHAAPARSRPAWSPPPASFPQPAGRPPHDDRGRLRRHRRARPGCSARSACARSSAA